MESEKQKHAHIFLHVPFEGPGEIKTWLINNNYNISSTRFYEGGNYSVPDKTDLLVIMGGPMGIYDYETYPWLHTESALIKNAIEKGIRIIGICLGAQLIADVLGEKVSANQHKEIGWFPVEFLSEDLSNPAAQKIVSSLSDPLRSDNISSENNSSTNLFTAFHWHGDTFPIPADAIRLFRSKACANQGFLWKNQVLALQFHLESNKSTVDALVKNCQNELVPDKYVHSAQQIKLDTLQFANRSNNILFSLLDVFLKY